MTTSTADQRLVSVIIPVYNGGPFLAAAIESVLNQTYSRVECIVIDDGSTDHTAAVIASFGTSVRGYSQPNQGVSAARNHGARLARGDLLSFLDADDCLKPINIERQLARLAEHPEAAVIYTAVELVDENGRHLGTTSVPPPSRAFANTVLLEPPALPLVQAALIRRDAFVVAGGFDERLSTSADCDLACRLAMAHPVEAVNEPLVAYRVHSNQMHNNLSGLERDMRIVHRKLLPAFGKDRALARRARANLHLILANCYWRQERRFGPALWHLAQAMFARPVRVTSLAARGRTETGISYESGREGGG